MASKLSIHLGELMTTTFSRAKALLAMILSAILVLAGVHATPPAHAETKDQDITVLSMNLWYGAQVAPDGPAYKDVAKTIEEVGADIVFFQETVTYKGDPIGAAKPIAEELGWNSFSPRDNEFYPGSASVISRFDIIDTKHFIDAGENNRWAKARLKVGDDIIAVYSGHLEYKDYAVYWPRGYAGMAQGDEWPENYKKWDKLEGPVTDAETIRKINQQSGRPDAAKQLIEDAKKETEQGNFVIFGGDFNEASALDWTEETKDSFQRNGLAYKWDTTQLLIDAGYVDTYRTMHPDPAKAPGTTWPVKQSHAPASQSAWMKDADERDRIDFIFYQPTGRITLDSAQLVGPKETVKKGEAVVDQTEDTIFTPTAPWISDHRATMAKFIIHPVTYVDVPRDPTKPEKSSDASSKAGAGIGIAIAAVVGILAAIIGVLGNFAGVQRAATVADQLRSLQR
ncbi:endonuclease/exonuclease/phosphatase family protein [Corynebacterium glaucum]|nr:endonuclease/exonuclease/phosphatase family protein [Corynebacterium glaucum]